MSQVPYRLRYAARLVEVVILAVVIIVGVAVLLVDTTTWNSIGKNILND